MAKVCDDVPAAPFRLVTVSHRAAALGVSAVVGVFGVFGTPLAAGAVSGPRATFLSPDPHAPVSPARRATTTSVRVKENRVPVIVQSYSVGVNVALSPGMTPPAAALRSPP